MPNTIVELLTHSNIRELADYLTDPKNNVISVIIVTRSEDGSIHHDASEGLHEVEIYGMLELAKKEFSTDFDILNKEDDLDG